MLNPSSSMNMSIYMDFAGLNNFENTQMKVFNVEKQISDAYRDLELHVSGREVALATRVPPKDSHAGRQNEDTQDHIHVFLNSNEYTTDVSEGFKKDSFSDDVVGARTLLGTIKGLGTSLDEGSCFVYNSSGFKPM